ncbi:MAG: hypothetical protein U1E71_09380 [Ramlibacter sp.]
MILSAERLMQLGEEDDVIGDVLGRRLAKTYSEFRAVVETDLVRVVQRLEENPQMHAGKSEDETTQAIVDMLVCMGYTANHNAHRGGNVDITVEQTRKNFIWIAEAKIFGDVGDLREGYLQLASRYRPGMDDAGVFHGGLIAYLRRPGAAGHMLSWRKHFLTLPIAQGASTEDCKRRLNLGFFSQHLHGDFGLPFRVWHLCVVLHFKPLDASGREAAKYA